jgi:hypothetical protein
MLEKHQREPVVNTPTIGSASSPPCDCLTFCGDDPGLHNGRATACEWRKKGLAAHAERNRIAAVASALLGIAEADGHVVVTVANMRQICKQLETCLPNKITYIF